MALGGRTIAEWQEVMSAEEFTDWMLYHQLNPFGPLRGDIQAATVAATMANIHAKKGQSFQVKDFLPEFKVRGIKREQPVMAPEQVLSFFQSMQRKQQGRA